jgi:hypothetical protein
LKWSYEGNPKSKPLEGTTFDLSETGITALKKGAYIVQRRKASGMHVKCADGEPILLSDRTKFEKEGVKFEYRES